MGSASSLTATSSFGRWSNSCASGAAQSAPRSDVEKATAARARFWSDARSRARLRYRTSSSCLQAMYQLDGTHIVTIEGLTPREGLSPIQQAMVEHHASQCGYCTPGMVAALEGIFEAGTSRRLERASHRSDGKSLPVHRLSAHPGGGPCGRSRKLDPGSTADIRRAKWPTSWQPALRFRSGSSMAGASFSPR